MVEYKDRLLQAMTDAHVTTAALAKALGISYQAVRKVENGTSAAFSARNNDIAATFLGVSPTWLATGKGPKQPPAQQSQEGVDTRRLFAVSMAHAMSDREAQTVPSTTWERVEMSKKGELHPVFRVMVMDAAMAPRVAAGSWIQVSVAEDGRPGDGVLVRDRIGKLHFRQLRSAQPGTWVAHAENPAFQPLESDRDGLEILAVLTAVEARWG